LTGGGHRENYNQKNAPLATLVTLEINYFPRRHIHSDLFRKVTEPEPGRNSPSDFNGCRKPVDPVEAENKQNSLSLKVNLG
jgi:hypothetical protein